MEIRSLTLIVTSFVLIIANAAVNGREIPAKFDQFLESHCFECHDDTVQKGDLNLLDLDFDLSKPALFKQWVHVFDRIESGEMPPAKKPRPNPKDLTNSLQAFKAPLIEADRHHIKNNGRVKVRRLTRREYQNTVHDLLGISLPLENHLPEDIISHVFDTEANAQQLSHFHLEQYHNNHQLRLFFLHSTTDTQKNYSN